MKRTTIIALLIVLIAGSGSYVIHSMRSQASGSEPAKVRAFNIPPKFQGLEVGMTEQAVLAKFGSPQQRKTNPRFEVKPEEQWLALQATVNAPTNDPDAAPTKAVLKAGAELEHRVKDVWMYPAGVSASLVLAFDGTGHLIKWSMVNTGAGTSPGGKS